MRHRTALTGYWMRRDTGAIEVSIQSQGWANVARRVFSGTGLRHVLVVPNVILALGPEAIASAIIQMWPELSDTFEIEKNDLEKREK